VATADLLEIAVEIEPEVTERTLEFWRYEGLLPAGERTRQEGKRPVWTYPAEASEQLRALLEMRRKTTDPNVLRVVLWYKGYEIPIDRVRSSLGAYWRKVRAEFETQLDRHRPEAASEADARWLAIQKVARTMAGKKGKGFPRLGRQELAERIKGVALVIGVVLDNETAMQRLEADGGAAERLIGLDRARRFRPPGVEPWLDGPAHEGLVGFSNFGSLARLISVTDSATCEELELARNFGRTLSAGISAFSRIADAATGRVNASGVAAITMLEDDPYLALVIPPLIVSILRSPELAKNMMEIIDALQSKILPVEVAARELAGLSPEEQAERLSNLSSLPFVEQARVKRVVASFNPDQQSEF
jgi:hypothetical protein